MVDPAPLDQFIGEDAFVDEGDGEVAGAEFAIAVLEVARIDDPGLHTHGLEVIVEEYELGESRRFPPIEDGNAGRLGAVPAPLLV